MKYCLNARQDISTILKADEIMLNFNDINILPDLIIDYPHLTIIINVPTNANIRLKDIQKYNKEGANIILAVDDLSNYTEIKSYDIPFYWSKSITSFYELRGVLALGVCQVLIGAPLYFDLSNITKFNIPIRLIANKANDDAIPRENNIKGPYIRPEDIQYYEKYVSTIEFYSENLTQEKTLFEIYKEKQQWPGNLTKIIANLKFPVDNRGLPTEFGQARMQCRQNCMRNGTCRFCETSFIFSKKLDEAKDEWIISEK